MSLIFFLSFLQLYLLLCGRGAIECRHGLGGSLFNKGFYTHLYILIVCF